MVDTCDLFMKQHFSRLTVLLSNLHFNPSRFNVEISSQYLPAKHVLVFLTNAVKRKNLVKYVSFLAKP